MRTPTHTIAVGPDSLEPEPAPAPEPTPAPEPELEPEPEPAEPRELSPTAIRITPTPQPAAHQPPAPEPRPASPARALFDGLAQHSPADRERAAQLRSTVRLLSKRSARSFVPVDWRESMGVAADFTQGLNTPAKTPRPFHTVAHLAHCHANRASFQFESNLRRLVFLLFVVHFISLF
jgi:hypothetical protein